MDTFFFDCAKSSLRVTRKTQNLGFAASHIVVSIETRSNNTKLLNSLSKNKEKSKIGVVQVKFISEHY